MGVTALAAAFAASQQSTPRGLAGRLADRSFVAVAIAAPAAPPKHTAPTPRFSRAWPQFVLSFAPPYCRWRPLTFALYHAGILAALPGVWLLLYGTAIVTGGAFSVRVVPVMGLCLMLLGGAALSRQQFGEMHSWVRALESCRSASAGGSPGIMEASRESDG